MKICVIANQEASKSAMFPRICDGILFSECTCEIVSRERETNCTGIIKKQYYFSNDNLEAIIPNHEIQIKAEVGKGITNIFKNFSYTYYILKFISQNKKDFDLFHVVDLDSAIPIILHNISHRKKLKFVYHIADFYADSRKNIPRALRSLLRKLELFVINKASATIICTDERIEQIKGSKPNNLTVIYNSPVIDQSKFNTEYELKSPINLTYVGGLNSNRFIKTIVDVVKNDKRFNLILAGYGNVASYVNEISLIQDNIISLGSIAYSEALKLYEKSDIMFAIYDPSIPNHRFSAPNKVYEAMLVGKPIIVARDTSVDKVVENENMGYVIDYDQHNLVILLEYIYNNQDELYIKAQNAKDAYTRYSWYSMRDRIKNMYERIFIDE